MNNKIILNQIAEIELQLEMGMANGKPLDNETEMLLEQELDRLTLMINNTSRKTNKKNPLQKNGEPDEKKFPEDSGSRLKK